MSQDRQQETCFRSPENQSMHRGKVDQGSDCSSGFESLGGDLASPVVARLRRSGYPFLRSVKCQDRDGVIVLSGIVPTFHLKQLAQELAAHTQGVGEVQNDLQVMGASYPVARLAKVD